jgi:hypothetical protein
VTEQAEARASRERIEVIVQSALDLTVREYLLLVKRLDAILE